jgi:DNA-binding transcriptional MerR regulator/predicted RNA methylase
MKQTLQNKLQQVSLAEAAQLLRVSKATLRNWDKTGKLTAVRHPINGYRLYDLQELRELQAQIGLLPQEVITSEVSTNLDMRGVRKLITRLHNILRDSDSQSNIITRFDELTKLLFAKVISDKAVESANVSPFVNSSTLPAPKEVRQYYKELATRYKTIIPPRFATLQCSDRAIIECVTALRPFNFASAKFDVKGLAYEEIIRNTFDKGDHQQFFTPPHIVDFIVSMLAPFIQGDVCDPASGTGGFLVSIARKNLNYRSLTSIEIDERLSWVSGINLTLHDAKNVKNIFLTNGGALGRAAQAYFNSFDTIVTNPPFGSDFSDRAALETMALGASKASRRRGILFLERCHALLRDNGTLAIILDEGVLNLSHALDVRHFLTTHFDLKAVISLPDTAFMPYATVNASILVLQKRTATDSNTSVFFAKAEYVGRKPNGDEDIRYERDGESYVHSDFPAILAAWQTYYSGAKFTAGENIYVADVAANLAEEENGHRIDFQYHHPSRWTSRELIARCKYPLLSLHDICDDKTISIIPSKELADTVIPYTGLAHIEPHTGKSEQVATPANSLKSAVKVYAPGDIVFAKMRPNLRKVALMNVAEPGYVSPECAVLSIKHDATSTPMIDPLLLSVLLRTDFVFGQILHLIGGIGRPRISGKELMQIKIPVPPKSEQKKIFASYFAAQDTASDLKVQAEKLHAQSASLLASSVQQVATDFVRR